MSIRPPELSSIFLPQGEALQWHPALVSGHTIADAIIAAAYVTMALAVICIGRRSQPGSLMPVAVTLLIIAGVMHATSIVTMWKPEYGVSVIAKLGTAAIAVLAAISLIRTLRNPPFPAPAAVTKSSAIEPANVRLAELLAANQQLRDEIAQRAEAEAEVRQLNSVLQAHISELQSLFKALPVGVAIATDPECSRIRSNETFAAMMGLGSAKDTSLSTPPFPMPTHLRVTHDNRDLPTTDQPMQRAVAQNAPVRDFELTIVRRDAAPVDVIVNAVPTRDADGKPTGCVATFQDISAHKQAERKRLDFERRLLQSQKLESIGVLAGGIAHDFNNLLTGVLGHTNFARGELARGSTKVDHLLAQVETSAQRAADLCRQLLAYAGKGRVVVRLIDLNVAVQQTVPLLKLAITKKVTLDLQLGAGLPPLRGDPSQINQMLLNLVTNASEAIGAGPGTITIRSDRVNVTPMDMLTLTASPEMEPGMCVCMEVRDTGCGIAAETIGHIFEPFFTTKFVGRGLGLAAVLGIVFGHRGGIRVSSQVGVGTTFEVFLPAMAQPARGTGTPFSPTSHRGTVLVVDDDITIREFASAVLSGAGYTVVTAGDGEEALTKLRRDVMQFDAVLLDLTMPKLDGEDTLIAMRMISANLPVVLTSGYGEQAVVQRFVGRGLADFLPKPFVSEALLTVINTVIERARAAAT